MSKFSALLQNFLTAQWFVPSLVMLVKVLCTANAMLSFPWDHDPAAIAVRNAKVRVYLFDFTQDNPERGRRINPGKES